jgi:hypothetical protein
MASLIFYEKAVALDRNRHQNLKIQTKADHFSFSRITNSVFLAGSEFSEASHDYPIVFVGPENGPFTAVALVGLSGDDNLMVDAQGAWEAGTYIPAFIRRYPFVLAGAEQAETLTVCLDEAYAGLGQEEGEPFFNPDGTETTYLKNVIEFLRLFHAEMNRTNAFAGKLAQLGLLSSKVITVEFEGQKRNLEGLWLVDEQKLLALDDAQTLELVRSGYMGLIYAHFLSLSNFVRLARREDQRRKAQAALALADVEATEPASNVVH